MIPLMFERVKTMLKNERLLCEFKIQNLMWIDSGNFNDVYAVFRPAGGTNLNAITANTYLVGVDLIAPIERSEWLTLKTAQIISFVQKNPMADNCVGYLETVGGFPTPIPTAEGRLVYRLMFSALFGD